MKNLRALLTNLIKNNYMTDEQIKKVLKRLENDEDYYGD